MEISKEKLSLMKTYPLEIMCIIFIGYCSFLALKVNEQFNKRIEFQEVIIKENTQAIQRNTFLFETLLKDKDNERD